MERTMCGFVPLIYAYLHQTPTSSCKLHELIANFGETVKDILLAHYELFFVSQITADDWLVAAKYPVFLCGAYMNSTRGPAKKEPCSGECGKLHVCKEFLRAKELCPGVNCGRGLSHDLGTHPFHRQVVGMFGRQDAAGVMWTDVLTKLRYSFPAICFDYSERGACAKLNCCFLHICAEYANGACFGSCGFSVRFALKRTDTHNLSNAHNRHVLSVYGYSAWRVDQLRTNLLPSHEDPAVPKLDSAVPKVYPAVPKVDPVVPKVDPVVPKVDPAFPKVYPAVPKVDPVVPKVDPAFPKVDPAVPKVDPAKKQQFNSQSTVPVLVSDPLREGDIDTRVFVYLLEGAEPRKLRELVSKFGSGAADAVVKLEKDLRIVKDCGDQCYFARKLAKVRLCNAYLHGSCKSGFCNKLHLCKTYLWSEKSCGGGSKCSSGFSHDLATLDSLTWSKDVKWRTFKREILWALLRYSFPRICPDFAASGKCKRSSCGFLHSCNDYVKGKCDRDCRLSTEHKMDKSIVHNLGNSHNMPILNDFGFSITRNGRQELLNNIIVCP